MDLNLPVWGYYPEDDRYFIDPLYAPYMRSLEEVDGQTCEVNNWALQGYSDGFVNPALVRQGWGNSFQLMHPSVDACPSGWVKGEDGWCVREVPEFGNNGLYSKDAFVAKYQYWNGYAPRLASPRYREDNSFDQRSVNPWSGNFVTYQHSHLPKSRSIYGHAPSKDSLIA